MKEEQKELYNYTKDHYEKELNRISPTCVSPIIAVRQIVKKAIYQYVANYCEKDINPETVFSQDDFSQVSDKIYNDIMEGSN